jgi:hypothetical protein
MVYVSLHVVPNPESKYQTPQDMKRLDSALTSNFPAMFSCGPPEDLLVPDENGSWEIRVVKLSLINILKFYLTHGCKFKIVGEELKQD